MTAELAEAYTSVGNDNDALVVPVGLAFAAALERRSELHLHMDDKSHPTLAGTYLAACTVYAGLFRRSPIGLAHASDLDAATAHFLQSVALETVEGYYRTGETSSEP